MTRINGYRVYSYEHTSCIAIEEEGGGQTASLDDFGLFVEVHPDERGSGYTGDCAAGRTIPLDVLVEALRQFREWEG